MDRSGHKAPPPRVVILGLAGVKTLDVVGPAEIISETARTLGDPTAYEVQIMSAGARNVVGRGGIALAAHRTIRDDDEAIDTLLVVGDPSPGTIDPGLAPWLRRRAPDVRRYGAIGAGVVALAEAGLLSGRTVAVPAAHATWFRTAFPRIRVDPEARFRRDGPVLTSATDGGSLDLALALVEEDHGRDIARQVAQDLFVFLRRPGGHADEAPLPADDPADLSPILQAQKFVIDNLAAPLSVEVLAKHSGMSPRNFARVFRRELGVTPAEFIASARTDAARRFLETTDRPLQRIAHDCGFADMSTMRRRFGRVLGLTPHQYRTRFRS